MRQSEHGGLAKEDEEKLGERDLVGASGVNIVKRNSGLDVVESSFQAHEGFEGSAYGECGELNADDDGGYCCEVRNKVDEGGQQGEQQACNAGSARAVDEVADHEVHAQDVTIQHWGNACKMLHKYMNECRGTY